MRCIFCKLDSGTSKSVEHIIPASLGNQEHILPCGWVCDACNNYLSRKVEAPFLNSEYGKLARFEMQVPSRRQKIPTIRGFHLSSRTEVDVCRDIDGLSISAARIEDEVNFIRNITRENEGRLIIPISQMPSLNYDVARFIGMIALEIFAYRCLDFEGWNDHIVDMPELDELRYYVRRGNPNLIWPVHIRKIYPATRAFKNSDTSKFQVLHEFDLLFIPPPGETVLSGEIYAVIAIFGIEYTLNLGGPEIDGYLRWLEENHHASFLYKDR